MSATLEKSSIPLTFAVPPLEVFAGNQVGCNRRVRYQRVKEIIKRLNATNPRGVHFNEKAIVSVLTGGTCSAMTLTFLDKCMRSVRAAVQETRNAQEVLLAEKVAGNLEPQCHCSSRSMRELQAAFNTIEIRQPDTAVDHHRNKVAALLNFFSLKTDFCSSQIRLSTLTSSEALRLSLRALKNGFYFIRMLRPTENQKLEECGHSICYIKGGDTSMLYDPNAGVISFPTGESAEQLFANFCNSAETWGFQLARFYHVAAKF